MTEEENLIRAVLAAPRDVSLRLIYADWLDDRGDPRGEYLRMLAALNGLPNGDPKAEELNERLQQLQTRLDPLWIALINRGRIQNRSDKEEAKSSVRRGRRRSRREVLEADVSIFLQQYARKSKNTPDPNDRGYDRGVEEIVKRMKPEDLDRLMRGEESE